jgi:hypothetical protein
MHEKRFIKHCIFTTAFFMVMQSLFLEGSQGTHLTLTTLPFIHFLALCKKWKIADVRRGESRGKK